MPGFLGSVSGRVTLNTKQAVAAYAALRAENARLVYALRGTGDSFVQAGKRMTIAGAGLLYVFGKAVNAAAEFERKMDFFAAVTEASEKQTAKLRDTVLDLATTSIYTADQIADGVIELGKAGVGTNKIINGIGEAMVNLGAAADISLAESGQIISSTLAQFGLGAKQAVHVTDLLAGAANASIADIADIGVSLKYVGGIAAATGLKLDDVTTAISILAKNGIRGSTAGTSLRQMIVSLGGATKPAYKELQKLGIITADGSNKFYDAQGNIKPLAKIYQILQKATEGFGGAQKAATFRTIFNNRALAAAAILTRSGAKGFKDMYGEMSKTTAADVAHKRLDNLSGDIKILKSNIHNLLIKEGAPFQDQLRGWTQGLTDLVKAFGNLPAGTQKAIVNITAVSGVALVAMGIFNILVGTIFKFAASMIKFGAAVGFVFNILRGFVYVFGLIFGGAAVTTIGAVIAAVLVLAGVFIILYKKVKPFRDFVNKLGSEFMDKVGTPIINGLKAVIEYFKKIAKDPKKAWEDLKKATVAAGKQIVEWAKRIGQYLKDGLKVGLDAVKDFAGKVVDFFKSLPGRALKLLTDFVKKVLSLFTFKNLGNVVGQVVGLVLKGLGLLVVLSLKLLAGWLKLLALEFRLLPKLLGYAIGLLVGLAIRGFYNLMKNLLSLSARITSGIFTFFMKLPGRMFNLAQLMSRLFVKGAQGLANWAIENGPKIVSAIVTWVGKLPGRIANFMSKIPGALADAASNAYSAALDFGSGLVHGIMVWVGDLPDMIKGALGNIIQAFKDLIQQGFDAAKNFAKGLWDGFKDGLGINSPSLIEKQMVQITQVTGQELKKLQKQTLQVQSAGRVMQGSLSGYQELSGMTMPKRIMTGQVAGAAPTSPSGTPTQVNNNWNITNPKPERATTSVGKAMKNKGFTRGWSGGNG